MQQLPLMPLEPPAAQYPERIKSMWRLYGQRADRQCAQCLQLVRKPWGLQYYLKCRVVGVEGKTATDWRAGWPACGRFRERKRGSNEEQGV